MRMPTETCHQSGKTPSNLQGLQAYDQHEMGQLVSPPMNVDSPVIQITSHYVQAADTGLEAGLGILARLVLYTSSSRFKHCIRRALLLEICLLWHWTTGLRVEQVQPWVPPYTDPAIPVSIQNTEWLDVSRLKHLCNVETRFSCPHAFLSSDFQCRNDVSDLK